MMLPVTACLAGLVLWLVLMVQDKRKRRKLPESGDNGEKERNAQQLRQEDSHSARNKTLRVSAGLMDYGSYRMTLRETVLTSGLSGLVFAGVAFIFYKELLLAMLCTPLGLLVPRFRKIRLITVRKAKLILQFKQALYCLSTSLTAGRSVENSFREAWKDLHMLYPDPNCLIVREFEVIVRRLDNGEPIEHAVADFAVRAQCEDVTNFSDVFTTCKRTGGNLVEVIRRTAGIIGDKLDIEQDISVMVAQKKLESRVLLAAPVCMVAVLGFSSPDYMAPLYSGAGPLIMTGGLLALGGCMWLTGKIMDIKV
ncbi:type II secretion system F family protein [Paenibacillus sp. UNC499MF]|uniref:type II secretion system F family protein n=1 Tax=Paenibacillus sp. UNC499MF TaxID=1502751 RepID=UPI00089FD122|nr:type II secretion system F family protein [Paenibacillus sp. UNC499MF]SEG05068.1 tight adherence protein B [Paenibacillus sp. UNC499MF]